MSKEFNQLHCFNVEEFYNKTDVGMPKDPRPP